MPYSCQAVSAIAAYRALLRIVGPAYIFVAFLGRIPLAMSQLGVLVLVSSELDSYGVGGAAAGVLAIANAIGSPIAGALADRIGQRPVVLVQSLVGAAGLVGFVVSWGFFGCTWSCLPVGLGVFAGTFCSDVFCWRV